MDTAALAAMFRDLVDAQYVVAADESKRPYECDGLSVYKEMPGLVVMPSSTEEVRAIMRLCHRRKVPVVVRGAGTGLSGGALPNPNGVLLSRVRSAATSRRMQAEFIA
jgi:glycolate oxidase